MFVIGGNPASNHPRLMRTLMHVRRNGGKVIVINPVVETGLVNFRVPSDVRSLLFGTKIASLYVQPHIGGDLALLTGVAKRIDEMGATDDEPSSDDHCDGWDELRNALARRCPGTRSRQKSGVVASEIDDIARRYAAAKNVVFSWTMGITHHAHGVQNVQAIANLALMRGMVGRPHAGLMPIRGHSNVQGIGSVGVTPKLKDAILERLRSALRRASCRPSRGSIRMACMEAAARRPSSSSASAWAAICTARIPTPTFAAERCRKLETLVYLNTTLNTGHAHGLAARDDHPAGAGPR